MRNIAQTTEAVAFSGHVKGRMKKRKITDLQVIECIRTGEVVGPPKWRGDKGAWTVEVRECVAGDQVKVVVALDPFSDDYITVVTTFE
jgi:uncharacterized protein DUF4258